MRDHWQESESEVRKLCKELERLAARLEAGEDVSNEATIGVLRRLVEAIGRLGGAVEDERDRT